jgi:hypothetical protein
MPTDRTASQAWRLTLAGAPEGAGELDSMRTPCEYCDF